MISELIKCPKCGSVAISRLKYRGSVEPQKQKANESADYSELELEALEYSYDYTMLDCLTCGFEWTPLADDFIASLESQLAATKARLAEYEVGFDPAVRMPKSNVTVWVAIPIINGYSYDEAFLNDGRWQSATRAFKAWERERVERWFPLPGKGGVE